MELRTASRPSALLRGPKLVPIHAALTVVQSDVFAPFFAFLFGALILTLFEAGRALLIIVFFLVIIDIILRLGEIETFRREINAACITAITPIATILTPIFKTKVITIKRAGAAVRNRRPFSNHKSNHTKHEQDDFEVTRNLHDIFL